MNIIIYARYSSHSQNETSIEGQLKVCREFASRNGYVIVGEYIDRALTGTLDKRPEFQRMVADSSKKFFQAVLVYQLDRFARNRYDSAIYKARLKKNGVRVLSAKENITDDASGVLMEAVLEGMAEYYSCELSQKVKRGLTIKAEKGLYNGGHIYLGYKVNPDNTYALDDNNAVIVRKIFEMYASGNTIFSINTCLKDNLQLKTKEGKFRNNYINRLLKNKRYTGVYIYKDIEIPGGMPRIISDELFNKVQMIMETNKKAPARTRATEEYLLTTKLFCGHCKDMMSGVGGTSKTGKVYHYYACNTAKKKLCNKKQVGKKYIEDKAVNKCREILTDENIAKIASAVSTVCEKDRENSDVKRLQKLHKDNERKQANLTQAVAECEIEAVRKGLYVELNNLNTMRAELEKQIAIEEAGLVKLTSPQIKFFLTHIRDGNADDIKYRKTLVTVLINAIYLYDDKITFILNVGDKPVEITEQLLDDIEQASECSCIDTNAPPIGYYKNFYYFKGGFAVTFKL